MRDAWTPQIGCFLEKVKMAFDPHSPFRLDFSAYCMNKSGPPPILALFFLLYPLMFHRQILYSLSFFVMIFSSVFPHSGLQHKSYCE